MAGASPTQAAGAAVPIAGAAQAQPPPQQIKGFEVVPNIKTTLNNVSYQVTGNGVDAEMKDAEGVRPLPIPTPISAASGMPLATHSSAASSSSTHPTASTNTAVQGARGTMTAAATSTSNSNSNSTGRGAGSLSLSPRSETHSLLPTPPDGQGMVAALAFPPPVAMLKPDNDHTEAFAPPGSISSRANALGNGNGNGNAHPQARKMSPQAAAAASSIRQQPFRPRPSATTRSPARLGTPTVGSFGAVSSGSSSGAGFAGSSSFGVSNGGGGRNQFGSSFGSSSFGNAYANQHTHRTTSFQTSAERAGARNPEPEEEHYEEFEHPEDVMGGFVPGYGYADELDLDVEEDGYAGSGRYGEARTGKRAGAYDEEYEAGLLFEDDFRSSKSSAKRRAAALPSSSSRLGVVRGEDAMEEDEDLEEDEEKTDAAGVFSFSSPYLQARTLQKPSPTSSSTHTPTLGTGTAAATRRKIPPAGVLSPSWTATTLSRMSISGTSPDARAGGLSSSPQSHPHQQSSSGITGRGANLLLGTSYPSSTSATSASPGTNGSIFGTGNSSRRRGSSARPHAFSPSSSAGLFSTSIEEHSPHHAGHPYARSRELASASKSRSRSRNRTLLASSLDARQAAAGRSGLHTDNASLPSSLSASSVPGAGAGEEGDAAMMDDDDDATDDEATEDEADLMMMTERGAAGGAPSTFGQPSGFGARRALYNSSQHPDRNQRRYSRDAMSSSSYPTAPTTSLGLMLSPSPGPASPKVHHHGALTGLSGVYAEGERSPLAPVSLSRQYSSEHPHAHAHPPSSASQALAVNRHHPYASSPNTGNSPSPLGFALGTSPNSAASGAAGSLAYSPGNSASAIMIANTRQMHRRGSSLTGGAQLAGSAGSASGLHGVSPGAPSFLSQSPRYGGLQTLSTRELPPGVYSDPPTGSFGSSSSRSPRGRVAAQADSKTSVAADQDDTDDDIPSGSDETDEQEILEAEQDEEDGEVGDPSGRMKSRSSRRVSEQQNGAGRTTSSSRRSTSRTRPPPKVAPGGSLDDGGDEGVEVAAIRERLGGAANCSAFISKLWYLMINPDMYSQYIRWSEAGDAIVISNDPDLSNEFAADVLPKLFKHGNNASFVRQLNLYGFQRIASTRSLDAIELKAAKAQGISVNVSTSTAQTLYGSHSSFTHPRFLREREELLPSMKPRSSKKPKRAGGGDESKRSRGGARTVDSDEDEE